VHKENKLRDEKGVRRLKFLLLLVQLHDILCGAIFLSFCTPLYKAVTWADMTM
jgi:hypothetical protein